MARRSPYSAAIAPARRKWPIASEIGPAIGPGALISMLQPSATPFSQDSRNTVNSRLLSSPSANSQPYSTPSTPTGMPLFWIRSRTCWLLIPASKQRLKSVRRSSTASKPPLRAASSAVASGVVSIVHICRARRPNLFIIVTYPIGLESVPDLRKREVSTPLGPLCAARSRQRHTAHNNVSQICLRLRLLAFRCGLKLVASSVGAKLAFVHVGQNRIKTVQRSHDPARHRLSCCPLDRSRAPPQIRRSGFVRSYCRRSGRSG